MEDLEGIATEFAAAHDAHDIDRLSALVSVDCELLSSAGVVRGRDAIRKIFQQVLNAFGDDRFVLDSVMVAENTLIFEWTYTATHIGTYYVPTGNVAPTGRRVRFRGVDLFEIESQKITKYRSYYDQLDILIQLGAVPAQLNSEPTS